MSSETNEHIHQQQQTADITNLQESFLQQQEKISALKELVRKSGAAHGSSKSAAQEKVKNIAERLKLSKAKSKQGLNVSTYTTTEVEVTETPFDIQENTSHHNISLPLNRIVPTMTPNPTPSKQMIQYSTPGSEKIALMRQQLEQNKLRMAQKASSKQHLEQLVSQLKEKFDSTQQCLEDTSELGRSMSDLSSLMCTPINRERHKSATDLSSQNFSLEKERIKFLENRCRLLEKQLEKEKQNNTKNNNIFALESRIKELEELLLQKEQEIQTKLESSDCSEVISLRERVSILTKENEDLILEIEKLNKIIEQKPPEVTVNDQLRQDLQQLQQRIDLSAQEPLDTTEILSENESLKKDIDMQLKRINELNEINDVLETTRCDLTARNTLLEEQVKILREEASVLREKLQSSEDKCNHLEVQNEHLKKHDTDSQVKSEMAKQIQELMDKILEIESENTKLQETIKDKDKLEINDTLIANKISGLEATIESQREELMKTQENLKRNEEELMEKTIELNVLNANFKVMEEQLEHSSRAKPLFSTSLSGPQDNTSIQLTAENQQLKQKLDESNKAMIKLKLKCKQTEKQIEKLKKGSDLHSEVVKLTQEKENLQQKLTELEDEKGQWQLTQMESSNKTCKHDETFQEYEDKIDSLTASLKKKESQLEALQQGEQTRVTSELSEIQMEEQIKDLNEEIKSLRNELENKEKSLKELNDRVEIVQQQKEELDKKLEHYLNENIELLDKVEKLSKSSSSAESIEIVERLTQQEKQELEEFNKRLEIGECSAEVPLPKDGVNELTQTEINPEITESLNKLRDESSELMSKIELFTNERREVLEKMEHLNNENHELLQKIEEMTQEKKNLTSQLEEYKTTHDSLVLKLESANKEKDTLSLQIAESKSQKNQLSQELTSLQQSSEVMAALDNSETLFDKCEKSLSKLNCELEAYRKAHDKKSKFNVSKKLAKEAENAHSQLSELLTKVKEASNAVETVTVVETVVAVTASNGKALAEYEQLTAQNRELKATISELRSLLDEARDARDEQVDNRYAEERKTIQADVESLEKLKEAVQKNLEYENQLTELQSRVEDLARELHEAQHGLTEKSEQITSLSDEIDGLKKLSDDFDQLINDKELHHEKQIEQLTRLRKELESKCDTYEQEMEILQTLVAEQKQQLIEAYKEHEHETNIKLLALQQQEQLAQELRQEIADLKQTSALAGSELSEDLQSECTKLREALRINKHLVQEQVEELSNKQETIDTLNQQIIDLYKTMEDNAGKIIEKEDEIAHLQEIYDNNKQYSDQLQLQLNQIESTNEALQSKLKETQTVHDETLSKCQELEQRNKEQLEKLKKYAANLKKRALQCQDLETKLKDVQNNASNPKELNELRSVNTNLTQELDIVKRQLTTKSEELVDLLNVRNVLEQEVKQLQLVVDEKQATIETLQSSLNDAQQQTSSWEDEAATELEQVQQDLILNREELRIKEQQLEECRNSLSETQNRVVQLEQQLGSTEEKWRSQLQSSQNIINQLQNDLEAARQVTSDWGDSSEIEQLHEELLCCQENLRLKVREIEELRQSLMAAHEQQNDWGNKSSVKNADYENMSKVLSDKSAKLEKVELIVEELENEIMALREKNHENQQKISELQSALNSAQATESQDQKLKDLSEELKAKSLKFEKSKAVIKERNGQIQRLQAQLKDLQEKLTSLPEEEFVAPKTQTQLGAGPAHTLSAQLASAQADYQRLNDLYLSEKANFQATITRLETLHDGIQAKLQEDMAYIESLEQENSKFKEKICRLEECVASFEERRASMERKVNFMDAQLQTSSEEHAKAEDELIYRLNMLSEHDEVIAQRLIDSQSEKEEFEENFRKIQTEYNQLQTDYNQLEREYNQYKAESSSEYEQELSAVREQLLKVESDLERQKSVFDGKLAAKATELDEIECEMNEQLEKLNNEKRDLSEQLERMTDDCSAHQNEILRLQENLNTLEQAKAELERESSWLRMQSENSQQDLFELQELRMQSMQDKTEVENLRHQIESLSSNHESELQALRTQIAELDTLRMQVGQNQTDDQVFIETENKRLTDLLAEKEAIIENYQRQNLQLQMAAAASNASSSNQPDPFALAFGLPQSSATSTVDAGETERLRHEVMEKTALVGRLQQDLNNLQSEFNAVIENNQEMQRHIRGQSIEASNLHTLQSVASSLSETQSNDVIPAPPMFFTSEASMLSPFDDIIQAQHIDNVTASAPETEQPTIEDLQRNVSDLEKHAQDLEHKLSMRNQREHDYEERLKDLEHRIKEKDYTLQQTKAANQTALEDLQNQIRQLEQLLQTKDQELSAIQQEQRRLLEEEHLRKTLASVDNQIVEDPVIQPTLDMFFGNAPPQEFEPFIIPEASSEPVEEEIIVPKKTYECHPEKSSAAAVQDASLDIGDEWGDSWGNNDAVAEAEHFAKQTSSISSGTWSLVPKEQMQDLEIQDLKERLQELQLSLDRSEDQKKELHTKSGKLMKKLKEYKVKLDELQTSNNSNNFRKSSSIESNSMFGDLDAAIQEELKNQIKTLEGQLQEQMKLYENLNSEKEKLLKRIDVLTLGNERMAEMKERQDMEVQMYQTRIRELQQKLESLNDWGNDETAVTSVKKSEEVTEVEPLTKDVTKHVGLQKKIEDLLHEVQDLTGDRLELQALLEEEKQNTQRSEQTVVALRHQLAALEEEKSSVNNTQVNNLKIELQDLRESYNTLTDVNNKLSTDFRSQSEILALSQSNELRLQTELDALNVEVENLRDTLIKTKQSLIDLEAELSTLKQQKEKQLDAAISCDTQHKSETDVDYLQSQINILKEENEQLKARPSNEMKVQELEAHLKSLEAENTYLKQIHGSSSKDQIAAQLQERESEIIHLKQRINDLMNEDQTEKLVLEILTKNQEIHMLKMEVKALEDDKHELENNLSLQLTKEMQASKETQPKIIGEDVEPLNKQINELLEEKRQMEEELQVLNNHVLESLQQEEKMKAITLELDTKNIEITELRRTVENLQNSKGNDATVNFAAINAQWESVVEQRCGEIAKMWQDHLAQREQEYKEQLDRLQEEISVLRSNSTTGVKSVQKGLSLETTSSSTPASESTTASGSTSAEASQAGTPLRIRSDTANDDDSSESIIEKMQAALESREMEIVTLKEQLAIRSAEYARLAAQYDPFKLQNTMSHIGVVESRKVNAHSGAEVAMVPKSELDLAMYMLHQRDMRCEEMTHELVSLLEERDTLQLKLSNTLRQVEAIRNQSEGLSQAPPLSGSAVHQVGSENVANISVAGSTVANVDDELNQKLSQLQSVSHSKDKVIKEEREQRSRQLEKLQQDVAKMPPAAVSELLGTDMSQTNQSPSTVLLNWLWGNKSSNPGGSQPEF